MRVRVVSANSSGFQSNQNWRQREFRNQSRPNISTHPFVIQNLAQVGDGNAKFFSKF